MEREMAEQVVRELKRQNGPQLSSVLEAMRMAKVAIDYPYSCEVYAIQNGYNTFLARKSEDGTIIVKVQQW